MFTSRRLRSGSWKHSGFTAAEVDAAFDALWHEICKRYGISETAPMTNRLFCCDTLKAAPIGKLRTPWSLEGLKATEHVNDCPFFYGV